MSLRVLPITNTDSSAGMWSRRLATILAIPLSESTGSRITGGDSEEDSPLTSFLCCMGFLDTKRLVISTTCCGQRYVVSILLTDGSPHFPQTLPKS